MANPRLPGYIPPADFVSPEFQLSRPTANTINETSPTLVQLTRNEVATGKVAPVMYGEDRMAGKWLTAPVVYSGELLFAILWCDAGLYGIEGVQTVYINGAAVPGSVTMTHYDGTQTSADPTLAAALSGFNDGYNGFAYTVLSIPTGAITGFPAQKQIEAVIQGRRLFDPRNSSIGYSQNPALALYDFAVNIVEIPAYGADACADRCDDIIGGVEVRCQIGLTITNQARAETAFDLLSAYAECLWSYSDDGILMVPDAPVDSPAAVLTRDDIKYNTLRITGNDAMRSPTEVTVRYREPSGTAQQWSEDTETRQAPEVGEGIAPIIPSTVHMPGIHRDTEAGRKALMRLRRLGYPTTYAWQAFDDGIKFQRGDVVRLPNMRGLTDRLVRILSLQQIDLGRYQMSAEHYSAEMYAFDFDPGDSSNVPEHGIILYSGSSGDIPSGWTRFAEADDRYIVGAGGTYAHGDTGGSEASGVLNGLSDMGGQHGLLGSFNISSSTGPRTGPPPGIDGVTSDIDEHEHPVSVSSVDVAPLARKFLWIQKTGVPGVVPPLGNVLSDGQIISAIFSHVSSSLGRLAMGGSTAADYGSEYQNATASSGDNVQPFSHTHIRYGGNSRTVGFPNPPALVYSYLPSGSNNHDHPNNNVRVTPEVRRMRLALYQAGSSSEVIPGCIIGFPAGETIPPGWHPCDGTNGTPDIGNLFIEFSSVENAGTVTGQNRVVVTGATGQGGEHSHRSGTGISSEFYTTVAHSQTMTHIHAIRLEGDYLPPYYAMQFIQFTGVV